MRTPTVERMPAIHRSWLTYREKVAALQAELADPSIAAEAKSVLRSLIEKIVIVPR